MSSAEAAAEAGREAALAAVAGLGGEAPALVFVYAGVKYDLAALLAAVRAVTGAAPLVGATTSGQFAQGSFMPLGTGVAVLALTTGPYRFGVASVNHIGDDPAEAGQRLARACRTAAGEPGGPGAVLLLADGLMGCHQQIVHGMYRVTGPRIPLVGGASSDDQQFTRTHVFHDDTVLERGAVAVWIASPHPLKVVTGHGWQPAGVPLLVSRSTDGRLYEIAGRPAAEVYEEQLGPEAERLKREGYSDISVLYPLGLLQPDGSLLMRVFHDREADGTLLSMAGVPSGGAVQVMSGTPDTLLGQIGSVASQALDGHPDPGVLLVFSCAVRHRVCGERIVEEAQQLQAMAGDVPTFGFYTYGEFARTRGVLGVHNATVTAIAL